MRRVWSVIAISVSNFQEARENSWGTARNAFLELAWNLLPLEPLESKCSEPVASTKRAPQPLLRSVMTWVERSLEELAAGKRVQWGPHHHPSPELVVYRTTHASIPFLALAKVLTVPSWEVRVPTRRARSLLLEVPVRLEPQGQGLLAEARVPVVIWELAPTLWTWHPVLDSSSQERIVLISRAQNN